MPILSHDPPVHLYNCPPNCFCLLTPIHFIVIYVWQFSVSFFFLNHESVTTSFRTKTSAFCLGDRYKNGQSRHFFLKHMGAVFTLVKSAESIACPSSCFFTRVDNWSTVIYLEVTEAEHHQALKYDSFIQSLSFQQFFLYYPFIFTPFLCCSVEGHLTQALSEKTFSVLPISLFYRYSGCHNYSNA